METTALEKEMVGNTFLYSDPWYSIIHKCDKCKKTVAKDGKLINYFVVHEDPKVTSYYYCIKCFREITEIIIEKTKKKLQKESK